MPRRDARLARIVEELEALFENELVDDRFEGVELTRFDLSPSRQHLTVFWLAPEGKEAEAAEGFRAAMPLFRERIAQVLFKAPELRFRPDRGAWNRRRVEAILEELKREEGPEKDP